MSDTGICKCGDKNCQGWLLLHEKELAIDILEQRKAEMRSEYGNDITFELRRSPSSGEIFTKFYELHIIK